MVVYGHISFYHILIYWPKHKHLQWTIFKWHDWYKKIWHYLAWKNTHQAVQVEYLTYVSGGQN
jgi:hypothetical protein